MRRLNKKPIQIYLEPSQDRALRWLAEKKGVPIAELIRLSVDCYLAQLPVEEDPIMGIIGLGKGGPPDLAERHDDYLVEELEKHHRG